MGDRRRLDDPGGLELYLVRLDALEQPGSRSEQDGREMFLELVKQAGAQELRHRLRASGDPHVLLAGR